MNDKLKLKGNNIKHEKKIKKIFKIALVIIILILLVLYFVVGIIYNSGNFSITLDKDLYFDNGLIIYDDPEYKVYRSELLAPSPETFDSWSIDWFTEDLDNTLGSHNGDNYLAYTFLIENTGSEVTDYYSKIIIDDVIKNVDEAVRIMVYKNGQAVTYAKLSSLGQPEPDTVAFQDDNIVASEHVTNFKPNDINRYTIVLWIEGNDPECTDNLLGGEFKVQMNFSSKEN